jgi:hypothetical protein
VWFDALAHNRLIDLARADLSATLAIHFAAGIGWAVVYANLVAPRMTGAGWQHGALFAVVPWFLSLAVFFPIAGAGFFGNQLGAGPLPILGNLVLHLVYGATLGAMFGPMRHMAIEEGEICETDRRAAVSAQDLAAFSIIAGGICGYALGAVLANTEPVMRTLDGLGLSPWYIGVAGLFAGAAWGGLMWSFAGLSAGVLAHARPAETVPMPHSPRSVSAQPIRRVSWTGDVPVEQWVPFYNNVITQMEGRCA